MPNFKPPEPDLCDEVDLVIKMFATAGRMNVTGFKALVNGHFPGELTAWKAKQKTYKPSANSQREFTELLLEVLVGNETKIRGNGYSKYRAILDKIDQDPQFDNKRNVVVNKLRSYGEYLRTEDGRRREDKIREAIGTASGSPLQVDGVAVSMSQTGDASENLKPFPYHIPRITELVLRAKTSIAIHADAVDYGSFRDFEAHRELLKAVINKAEEKVPVFFLISTDHQPMSRANKYRDPNQRKHGLFYLDLQRYLTALGTRYTDLSETEDYKRVEEALSSRADFASEGGAIKDLFRLQAQLYWKEFRELKAAGVQLHGSSADGTVAEMYKDGNEIPIEFSWIVDEAEEIRVITEPGSDAGASQKRGGDVRAHFRAIYAYFDRRPSIP